MFFYCKFDRLLFFFFFFNDTATTEIYTLSLHDALPILRIMRKSRIAPRRKWGKLSATTLVRDRKSTRLNSSHTVISYAVFCLKKKKQESQLTHENKKQQATTKQEPASVQPYFGAR